MALLSKGKVSMMDSRHDEEENMVALYEASQNGCVSILNTFIQKDACILDRVSLTSFSETPLHIAALHGHLEFSKLLISRKPKLAEEVDSLGRTPLHLASAEGHTEIVKALLEANTNVCLAFDKDEKIPLYLAAMRGRIEIIKELIIARRESIWVNLNGNSVLHLCIRYNHLDAMKLLVELANGEELFLSSKDHDGNSILHLTVMLKQMKVIKYLLSVPEIKREANALNKIGYTALDVLEVCAKDFKCFEIQNILKEAGVRRSTDLNSSLTLALSGAGVYEAEPARSWSSRWWGCLRSSLGKRLNHKGNWIEETRGTLMVVVTVMATMAFQAGISPPGGVWQQDMKKDGFNCSERNICKAGTSVLSYSKPNLYRFFLYSNTISFFASLCVILLVISRFSLRSTFFIWLLTSAMLTSVVSTTLTYLFVVSLLTSYDLYYEFRLVAIYLLYTWMGVVLIASVIHIIRLLHWLVKRLIYIICLLCWMVKKLIHIIVLPIYWMLKKLCNFIRKLTRVPAEDPANV